MNNTAVNDYGTVFNGLTIAHIVPHTYLYYTTFLIFIALTESTKSRYFRTLSITDELKKKKSIKLKK